MGVKGARRKTMSLPSRSLLVSQPGIVYDFQRGEFALSHSEIKERENGGRGGAVRIFDTIAHEFCFFFVGEGIALLGLVAWQYDFRHGRRNFEIVCGDVEDTAQEVGKFLRGAIFAFPDECEQIILQFFPIDVL